MKRCCYYRGCFGTVLTLCWNGYCFFLLLFLAVPFTKGHTLTQPEERLTIAKFSKNTSKVDRTENTDESTESKQVNIIMTEETELPTKNFGWDRRTFLKNRD